MITLSEMTARAAGQGAKTAVTVERLLQWAYAEELVHMARPEGMPADLLCRGGPLGYKAQLDVSMLGAHVNSSSNSGFEAAPDAYRVHDAVMSLGSVELEIPEAARPFIGSAKRYYFDDGQAIDAGVVANVFSPRFTVALHSLVFDHALRGQQPDWVSEPALAAEKIQGGNVWGSDGRGRRIVVMCGVRFIGDKPWDVARDRLLYSAWVDALEAVRARIDNRLERFVLAVDKVVRCPWVSRE